MNSLLGIEHHLDVGVGDPIEDDVIELTLARDFGGLARGTTLAFRAGGNAHGRAYLPVTPTIAEVIATDAHGRPALLARHAGDGDIILCTYPIEHMAAVTPRVNPDATVTLYEALAAHAGVRRPVTVSDPRVSCDMLVRDDGVRFAVLASHAPHALVIRPRFPNEPAISATLDGTETGDTVTIDPFGVSILKLQLGGNGALV
jgi:hypothetical protein